MSNFGRGSPKEPSCKIFSKSMHWLRRRSHLKVFLFLALSIHIAEEVVKSLFLLIALAACLFNVAEAFQQFW